MLKPGSRLKSAVCDAEVMVIKAGADDEVTCGGAVMATDVSENPQAMMHTCTAASSANAMSTKAILLSCCA